eukprot:CAMPEP_0172469132 /NCGR_PEP_ID=MMETSP1065-20121228/62996_1 /TAXON_ID=265537 /ORGANISM="Amphiprora paludosa, Strain CCMP125" /LENGTH=132 /DNA_ID=CAMNT_0013226701 /DNA_START=14 /DNA_END=409 /DNA_ORIENTATION=+
MAKVYNCHELMCVFPPRLSTARPERKCQTIRLHRNTTQNILSGLPRPSCSTASWNGPELWEPLKRYTQIPISIQDDIVRYKRKLFDNHTFAVEDLYRIHAILNGWCDTVWSQSLGALDEEGQPGYVHDATYL